MDATNLLVWLVVGAIAGWLASVFMRTNQGLLADIVVGIIGAFLGGLVLNLIPGVSAGVSGINLGSILTAFVGAVLLLALLRAVARPTV
jgi:uncharacterized membrane protein YeaQ/YmgE (transglycosylase-associated protein family)